MPPTTRPFDTLATFESSQGPCKFYSLPKLTQELPSIQHLPLSLRVLLESVLRNWDDHLVNADHIGQLAAWSGGANSQAEVPFLPARVILQDFTGVPAIVDLAAMRSAMVEKGGDPQKINPQVPIDLVIDHSVQVDHYGSRDALGLNVAIEFERNRERYEFLHWGQQALHNFRVIPPNTGIVHQVNLEYIASVATTRKRDGELVALPDSLVGTDSHTTMINGLGVLGWGVGGIEAEAVMLGQPIYMLIPEVVGFRLSGQLPPGATATDAVLTVTQLLRKKGVVGKFVEFYGEGLDHLSLPDRATIANMAPEYGATAGFFPVDSETLRYLTLTGRSAEHVDFVERYYKEQGMFRTAQMPEPTFSETVELDLTTIVPSLAGPKRPQDRIPLPELKNSFRHALTAKPAEQGFALTLEALNRRCRVKFNGQAEELTHGSVVIAAITSCTNTSNPSVMIGAGLLAKKAVERGLRVKAYVKTSLAPGSRVVTDYLRKADLLPALEQLGFDVVGYGCTTCIGNSGPLPEPVVTAIKDNNLVAASVLSGNRNFEGRVNPHVKANYLASPPLVVAYGLAGTTDIDLATEPIGTDSRGDPVYLKEIWPTPQEIREALSCALTPEMFKKEYENVLTGNETWNAISSPPGDAYEWNKDSTYIQHPPFFIDLPTEPSPIKPVAGARVLVMLGDSVTTDHISPAGAIPVDGPAGQYLLAHGVKAADFNSFGSRRGNDRVMTRGTFANIRLKNLLVPGSEGGVTEHLPSGECMSIFEAAQLYKKESTPLIVLAGWDYGMGSSRDWAAKGTLLLGVRAVIAQSFERIHRSNLIGMGVLPLQFASGEDCQSIGIDGREIFNIQDLRDDLRPGQDISITATANDGTEKSFTATLRIDTAVELDYYRHGGILQMVLRNMLKSQ